MLFIDNLICFMLFLGFVYVFYVFYAFALVFFGFCVSQVVGASEFEEFLDILAADTWCV